jgi:hypothetical protein
MKLKKSLSIIGITLILSLLLSVIPAMPALAATNQISISPSSGKIGGTVSVIGENFIQYESTADYEYWGEVYFAKDSVLINTNIEDADTYSFVAESNDSIDQDGYFEASFTVPDRLTGGIDDEDVTTGTYYVYVSILRIDNSTGNELSYSIKAKETFTVTASGTLNPISPTSGPAGTDVNLSGVNFPSGTVSITMDGVPLAIKSGSTTTSGGSFISTVTIPSTASVAVHNITVTVGSASATRQFTVTSSPTLNALSPSSGPAGTDVTVSGTGFPNGTIAVAFDGTSLPIKSGNSQTSGGSFISIVTIPSTATFAVYTITVTVGTATASQPFTVTTPATTTTTTPPPLSTTTTTPPPPTTPVLNLSTNNQHNVGADIGMSGTGFTANAEVTVSFDGEAVGSAKADANGTLVVIFPVPAAKHGDHTITATDGTHTGTITFTVESDPPSTPQPLTPAMDIKVKSPVSFEWEPATDASPPSNPVTYELQIATTVSFSSSSIILDETGLKVTSYTLTPAEELELTGKAPYYWRIRSLDAASNPSPWTGAGVFYAAGSSSFPTWALYTIMGVGAVLVFLIGYWLGRRSAFYY